MRKVNTASERQVKEMALTIKNLMRDLELERRASKTGDKELIEELNTVKTERDKWVASYNRAKSEYKKLLTVQEATANTPITHTIVIKQSSKKLYRLQLHDKDGNVLFVHSGGGIKSLEQAKERASQIMGGKLAAVYVTDKETIPIA